MPGECAPCLRAAGDLPGNPVKFRLFEFSRDRTPLPTGKIGRAGSDPIDEQAARVGLTAEVLRRTSTADARSLIAYEVACRFSILPLAIVAGTKRRVLTVAGPPTLDSSFLQSLRAATECEVQFIRVPSRMLEEAIFAAYHGDEQALVSPIAGLERLGSRLAQKHAALPQMDGRPSTSEVIIFLDTLIGYAVAQGATDIHLVPRPEGTLVQLRLHGELLSHERAIATADVHAQLISRIKVMAKLDTASKGRPLDGSFRVPVTNSSADIRVSVMPTFHGEKAVLRILGNGRIVPFRQLGLDAKAQMLIERALH